MVIQPMESSRVARVGEGDEPIRVLISAVSIIFCYPDMIQNIRSIKPLVESTGQS